MAFALSIEILLAQIPMPAFQEEREEAKFVVVTESGHAEGKDVAAFVSNAETETTGAWHKRLYNCRIRKCPRAPAVSRRIGAGE